MPLDNLSPTADASLGMSVSGDVLAVTRVVWLSGGKDSTAMALRLAEVAPSNSPAHRLMHPDSTGPSWYSWAWLFETQASILWQACDEARRAA